MKFAVLPLFLLLFLVVGSVGALLMQLDYTAAKSVLTEPEIHFAFMLSLASALCSLIISMLIGIPAAWALTRKKIPGKKIIDALMDLPMVTPPLVTGMGLLLLLGNQGMGKICSLIADNLFSPLGIIIAQSYVASSIMLRNSASAFMSLDQNYIKTAFNLGLPPWKTFLLVELPLCWRAISGSAVIALSKSLGEFGATLMLAGATRFKTETLPVAIYLNIASGDFKIAVGCALLLLFMACILLMSLHFIQKAGLEKNADH